MNQKKSFKDLLETLAGSLFLSLVVIVVLLIVPFLVIKDTIKARGGIVNYNWNYGGGGSNNYVVIASSIFLWWTFFKFIKDNRQGRQKYEKLQQKIEQAKTVLSDEEKTIQMKMDQTLQNIAFLGYISDNKSKGRFCCQSCGHQWEAKIEKIYYRKMCGQYNSGVSYLKSNKTS